MEIEITERPYKIYRLADPRYSDDDNRRVRYIDKTQQDLKHRLVQHCNLGLRKVSVWDAWIAELLELSRKPEIELIEIVDSQEKAVERKKFWVEHYILLGYLVMNREGAAKRDVRKLSASDIAERRKFLLRTLEPIFARSEREGVEQLLYERKVMLDFYEVEDRLIAELLVEKLEENGEEIRRLINEDELEEEVLDRVIGIIDAPIPERSKTPSLKGLKRELREKTGLPQGASLQECISAATRPSARKREETLREAFAKYKRDDGTDIEAIERDVLERIERGEIKGVTAQILKDALGDKKPEEPAFPLDDMPALKHYMDIVKEKGEDWFIYYMGKEPTAAKREKVEALKRKAEEARLREIGEAEEGGGGGGR